MSEGHVGKRAASDMAADIVVTRLLDWLAVHQPALWERLRQTVLPHQNLAQGGMIVAAELVAALKDNLKFLPSWAHQIVDTGLAQTPMTIVNYFKLHQARQTVLGRVGHSLDGVDVDKLAADLEQQLINSPEFKRLAEDAWLGRLMRNAQAYQAAVKSALASDFRLPLLDRFRQVVNDRHPARTENDELAIADFGLWLLRQNESVCGALSGLLAAKPPVTKPLDLLSLPGLLEFRQLDDAERLRVMTLLADEVGQRVVASAPAELFGPDEPTDPGARLKYRAQSINDDIQKRYDDQMEGVTGSVESVGRYLRECFQTVNGSWEDEQETALARFLTVAGNMAAKRRRTLEMMTKFQYETLVLKSNEMSEADHAKQRALMEPDRFMAECQISQADLERDMDRAATMLEGIMTLYGFAVAGIVGSMEAMFGDKDKPR